MSAVFFRSDIHSAALAGCSLSLAERSIVMAQAKGGSWEQCHAALLALVCQLQSARWLSAIPVPRAIADENIAGSWRGAAMASTGKTDRERSLDVRLPALVQLLTTDATEAADWLRELRTTFQQHERSRAELLRRRDLFRETPPSRRDLARQVFGLRLGKWTCALLEAAAVGSVVAARFGFGSGLAWSALSPWRWVQAIGVSGSVALGTLGLPLFIRWLARDVTLGGKARAGAVFLAVAAMLVLAVVLGGVRYVGSVPLAALSVGLSVFASQALVATAVCAGLVLSVLTTLLHHLQEVAGARLHVVTNEEEALAREIAALDKKITGVEEEIARAGNTTRLPGVLRAAFEQAVQAADTLAADQAREVEACVTRARGVYQQLATLSPAEVEQVANAILEIEEVRVDSTPTTGGHPLLASLSTFSATGAAFLLALPLLAGCDGNVASPHAESLIVACDPTGASPEDVCTTELIGSAEAAWAGSAFTTPNAVFRVVHAGGDYSTTVAESPLPVPDAWGDDASAGIAAWQRSAAEAIRRIRLVADDGNTKRNRSDLISLVAISARFAREASHGSVDLLLASDGRLRSLGFNAEREVPSADAVLARIRDAGIRWELDAFANVTICGFHNADTSAKDADAREALWRAILRSGHAPEPRIVSSCRGLYPAAPLVTEAVAAVAASK